MWRFLWHNFCNDQTLIRPSTFFSRVIFWCKTKIWRTEENATSTKRNTKVVCIWHDNKARQGNKQARTGPPMQEYSSLIIREAAATNIITALYSSNFHKEHLSFPSCPTRQQTARLRRNNRDQPQHPNRPREAEHSVSECIYRGEGAPTNQSINQIHTHTHTHTHTQAIGAIAIRRDNEV
jgi:hypothetical protein